MYFDRPVHRLVMLLGMLCIFSVALGVAQEGNGSLQGRVIREDGSGIGGVSVVLIETAATAISGPNGNFSFGDLAPGTYSISLALGENVRTVSNIEVPAGETTNLEETVDWDIGFAETLTVYSASRKIERIVEAPAAVTMIDEQMIENEASHGQLPKLLEFTPGVEVTQSGIYDYNLNTRGFNSSLNRRVATLIDGRNPSVPFLGAQEWSAISFPLDDLSNIEFVRGPSAALYGANASSGVLNMITRQPRNSRGGLVRFTGGLMNTVQEDPTAGAFNFDFRWAGALGNDWYAKAVAGVRRSGDFTVSRNGAAEYSRPCRPGEVGDCLPQEAIPLDPINDDRIYFGGVRFDKHLASGSVFTMEGGFADVSGPVTQTGIGRVQLQEVQRPWARFNFNSDRYNILAYYTGRNAPRQAALASGANLALDTYRVGVEGQTNWNFAQDKVQVVVGGSASYEDINSEDPDTGRQTLMFAPVDADMQALFGQLNWYLTDELKVVLAGRGDWSKLHTAQFSPKASLVYAFNLNNSVRFTYNQAFQVGNYSEFFLQADVAAPADLSALEGFCAPFGVDCGFTRPTRVLGLGNSNLDVERIRTWEIGYSGILASKAYFTMDYYNSKSDNFITDLLPNLGTSLGRINPEFGAWQGPEGLPAPVEAAIRAVAPPILSNNFDGSNILAAVSYTNFGEVDTQGIDIGLNYYFTDDWTFSFSYSWFDFSIKDILADLEPLLLPNSPEHKFSSGLAYSRDRFNTSFSVRWVDEFLWAVGPFRGPVESYTTVDLTANYDLTESWTAGLSLANLFNSKHYEAFGGDLLGIRALFNIVYRW